MGANVYNCGEIVYKMLSRFRLAHGTIKFGFRRAIPASLDCLKNSATFAWGVSSMISEPARERLGGGQSGRAAAIYRSIFDAVVDQRVPPGAKLTEEQLGALFGASRTIVRSALQALAHDHIVTIKRHRGAFVSAPTIADAKDIFLSRRLVESGVAQEVASQIRPEHLQKLRALLADEDAAIRRGDRRSAIRLSGAFHMAIARIRGEGALTQFLGGLISRSSLVIALYGRGVAPACGPEEHLAIMDALAACDGSHAAALMADHLEHILSDLVLTPRSDAAIDLAAVLRADLSSF